MAAIDDLTELVERAAVAERTALSAKWKERADVEKTVGRARKSARDQRADLSLRGEPDQLSSRWVSLRQHYLDLGPQEPLPGQQSEADDDAGPDVDVQARIAEQDPTGSAPHRLSMAAAAQAERDAVAAVELARLALTDAALAVVQARLARIDAGEDDADAAVVDGHVPLHGRNPVSRHGPALAHGVRGEISYILTRKPRSVVKSLAITLAMGLLYLGWIRLFEWDTDRKWLPYLGLWAIGVVMGGSVCVNAMSFDAMRVRAALDGGARLWHLLVIKNLALLVIVAPIGFVICALLAWRAGDIYAFYKACALMVCMILLWLGVGNVLSVALPSRDEPIKQRKQSGILLDRLSGQRHVGVADSGRGGPHQPVGLGVAARHPDHRVQHFYVAPADHRRRRPGPATQGATADAEGDHRLQGECRDAGAGRGGGGREGSGREGSRRSRCRTLRGAERPAVTELR
jgi:hypothetical protein